MGLLLQLPIVHRLGYQPRGCFGQAMSVLSQLDEPAPLRLRSLRSDDGGFRRSNLAQASCGAQLGDAATRLSRLPPISRLDSEATFLPGVTGQAGDSSTGLPILQGQDRRDGH